MKVTFYSTNYICLNAYTAILFLRHPYMWNMRIVRHTNNDMTDEGDVKLLNILNSELEE